MTIKEQKSGTTEWNDFVPINARSVPLERRLERYLKNLPNQLNTKNKHWNENRKDATSMASSFRSTPLNRGYGGDFSHG